MPSAVMSASTIEAPNMWEISIAGMASLQAVRAVEGLAVSVKRRGWMPSSMPTASAAAVMPMYAPMPGRPDTPGREDRGSARRSAGRCVADERAA